MFAFCKELKSLAYVRYSANLLEDAQGSMSGLEAPKPATIYPPPDFLTKNAALGGGV